MSLTEPILGLCIFGSVLGLILGVATGDPMLGVAVTIATPLSVMLVFFGMGALLCGFMALSDRSLKKIDPDWEENLKRAQRRFMTATYRWQIKEFGRASKSFEVEVSYGDNGVLLGAFKPEADLDFEEFDDISEEEYIAQWDARALEVSDLVPCDDALARLHEQLRLVAEETLGSDLWVALVKKHYVYIETTKAFAFSDPHCGVV